MKTAFFFASPTNNTQADGAIVVDGKVIHLRAHVYSGLYSKIGTEADPKGDEIIIGSLALDRFQDLTLTMVPADQAPAEDAAFEGNTEDPQNIVDLTDAIVGSLIGTLRKCKILSPGEKKEFLAYFRDRLLTDVEQALE